QISEPTPFARGFGRYNALNAPANVAALSDGRVVVTYEGLDPFAGVFARVVSPDGSLSPEITCDGATSAASVIVPPIFNNPVFPDQSHQNDFIVASYTKDAGHGSILANWYAQDGSDKGGGSAYQLMEGFAGTTPPHEVNIFGPSISALPGQRFLLA